MGVRLCSCCNPGVTSDANRIDERETRCKSGIMMGADDGFSEIPQWQTKAYRYRLARAPCQSLPNMVKWANVRSKQLLEIKGIRCIYLKVSMIKSDTYHDTWTNYLMEQEPLLILDQADGDGCCCC
jgi:hypothetical protein